MRKGDQDKRTEECKALTYQSSCPNLKEREDNDMSGERYDCTICGASYYLDYDEIR